MSVQVYFEPSALPLPGERFCRVSYFLSVSDLVICAHHGVSFNQMFLVLAKSYGAWLSGVAATKVDNEKIFSFSANFPYCSDLRLL